MLLKLLPLALFVAIAGFLWKGLSLDPGTLPSPLIDKPAPAFTVATLPRPGADPATASAGRPDTMSTAAVVATDPGGAGEDESGEDGPESASGLVADGADGAAEAAVPSGGVFDSEAMKGRVWVLNVWASWCGPCAQEHPQLVALTRVRDVPVVGLNYKDDPNDARAWLARYGDIFSDVLSDVDGSVGLDWGVYGVPETFVIDADGQVRFKHVGPVLPDDLENTLLPIIDELAGSPS